MQTKLLITVILFVTSQALSAQYKLTDSTKRCYVGSTLALLGNFSSSNNPEFAQLNFGYRLSEKDVISIELKTWKYAWSLGIPYGKDFESEKEKFPGYIREYGFAAVYQRFLWKKLYAAFHVMPAWQSFYNEQDQKIDNGFQLFNTYRVGYHIPIRKGRFFLEPSIAVTHRPFHTTMPQSFKVLDDKWNKYFVGEPGFHFGYNF